MRSMTARQVVREARQLILAEIENLKAHGEVSDKDDGDGQMRSNYMGTVFSLTPSGKYYMPWACSNVSPCPRCKGKGTLTRHTGNSAVHAVLKEYEAFLVKHMFGTYEHYWSAPDWFRKHLDLVRSFEKDQEPTMDCPNCGGVGSREAYLDELWQETIEAEASANDCYVFSGEGDPCDLFIGQDVEETEEVEA